MDCNFEPLAVIDFYLFNSNDSKFFYPNCSHYLFTHKISKTFSFILNIYRFWDLLRPYLQISRGNVSLSMVYIVVHMCKFYLCSFHLYTSFTYKLRFLITRKTKKALEGKHFHVNNFQDGNSSKVLSNSDLPSGGSLENKLYLFGISWSTGSFI